MKPSPTITLFSALIYMSSCSSSPTERAESAVKTYLSKNLVNAESYLPLSFSQLDTLETPDTTETSVISLYEITHFYSVKNSDAVTAKMTVSFYLDSDLKVTNPNTSSINGNFGVLTGNAFWKFNNYVGNKPDAGSTIALYALDSIRGNMKFESTADVQGNYRIERVFPGNYLLVVRSKNATDCPDIHLSNIISYNSQLKYLFGFDIESFRSNLNEIESLDSLHNKISLEFPINGSYSQMMSNISKTERIAKERDGKIKKLFELFPDDYKNNLGLYTEYSKALDFTSVRIEEGETKTVVTDFGITCI